MFKEGQMQLGIKSTEVYAKIKVVYAFRQIQNSKAIEIKTVSQPSPTA